MLLARTALICLSNGLDALSGTLIHPIPDRLLQGKVTRVT